MGRVISLLYNAVISVEDNSGGAKEPVSIVMPEHCRRPHVDHRNQLFNRFHENVSLICPTDEVIMTSMDASNGNLSLDLKAIENLGINCTYSFVASKTGDDKQFVLSKPRMFPDSGSIFLSASENIATVSCTDGIGDKIYSNTHMFIPRFPSKFKSSPAKPNVLVILLSSLSQLTFHRLMRETKSEMNKMHFQYLNYFVTLQEHQAFNMIAFLTGRVPSARMKHDLTNKYYDDIKQYKFIWEEFRDKHYTTGLMSDTGTSGMFDPHSKGFREKPTHFYPHAFWNQISPVSKNRSTELKDFCFGMNGYKAQIFVDQVLDFVGKNRNQPYFLIASYNQMTRYNVSNFKLVDPFFAEFFKKLKLLTMNTIVMFAGDYGLRNSPYVATSIGRLEERMSLFSVRVPDSISAYYPHMRKMLASNRDRLMSWLDGYVMLRDVAEQSFHTVTTGRRMTMGLNAMRQEIPKNRSCDDAGIQDEYCVCGNHVYLNLHAKSINSDVDLISKSLQDYVDSRCQHTVLIRLIYAYYDVSANITIASKEAATVCFTIGDSRKRFLMNMTRDWNGQPTPVFKITSTHSFDRSMCN